MSGKKLEKGYGKAIDGKVLPLERIDRYNYLLESGKMHSETYKPEGNEDAPKDDATIIKEYLESKKVPKLKEIAREVKLDGEKLNKKDLVVALADYYEVVEGKAKLKEISKEETLSEDNEAAPTSEGIDESAMNDLYVKFLDENKLKDNEKSFREYAQSLGVENFDTLEKVELNKAIFAKLNEKEA